MNDRLLICLFDDSFHLQLQYPLFVLKFNPQASNERIKTFEQALTLVLGNQNELNYKNHGRKRHIFAAFHQIMETTLLDSCR